MVTYQARVQEFVRGGAQNLKGFFFFFFCFFCFSIFQRGGPAQKIAEKMIFLTKKVAKYRWNSLKFALMTFFSSFFLLFNFSEIIAQKIAEKMIFLTKKVAKYRWNSSKFALMPFFFFFFFQFLGGAQAPWPPWTRACISYRYRGGGGAWMNY